MRITMLMAVLAMAVPCGTSVGAETPFLDLTYQQALERAAAEDKPVLVEFHTTDNPGSQKLQQTLWKDAAVRDWLREHAIPIRLDRDLNEALAMKLNCLTVPEMIFILDGDPNSPAAMHIHGVVSSRRFLERARQAIRGLTYEERVIEAYQQEPDLPRNRMAYAHLLERNGMPALALHHYRWCWETGMNTPGSGSRHSFLLGDIKDLAEEYPPAREAMVQWRDQARAQFESAEATRFAGADYINLTEALGASGKELLAIHDSLESRGELGTALRREFGDTVRQELYTAGRFDDYMLTRRLPAILRRMDVQPVIVMNSPDAVRQERRTRLNSIARDWEVLLILDRQEDAGKLLDAILKQDQSEDTFEILDDAAWRAGSKGAPSSPTKEQLRARSKMLQQAAGRQGVG